MKVLIVHAYSAENRGDGLLVEETVSRVQQAFGSDVEVSVVASYPKSFEHLGCPLYNSRPSLRGYDPDYVRLLLTRARDYDAIVSVGGGFLRGKTLVETVKTSLVHGPQLVLAASRREASVYLPQSIGPFSTPVSKVVMLLLKSLGAVWLRDDRSVVELQIPNAHRAPDLAILGMTRQRKPFNHAEQVVMTVRHVNGQLTRPVKKLRKLLGSVDSYVQSNVSSNSDVRAVQELAPHNVFEYSEFMTDNEDSRVVVAVRLHAALMALAAGHYVVHLAYERKGFGAFQDLGLEQYVHNVNDFDAERVLRSVNILRNDASVREHYDRRIELALERAQGSTDRVLDSVRAVIGVSPDCSSSQQTFTIGEAHDDTSER